MSVNRFVNIDWGQPQNAFVPRPFAQMDQLGRASQHRYDEGKALKDTSLGVLNDIKAASFDQDAKNELVNKYNKSINELVDKYHQDFGSNSFKYELSQLTNQAKNDTEFQRLSHNKKFEDEVITPYNKDKTSAGNINHFKLDPNYTNNKEKKWMTDIPYTQYADAREHYSKVFDKIKDQATSLSKADVDSKSMGEGYYFVDKDGQHKYIDKDQIQRITDANFSSFLNSKEGAYEFHKHLVDTGIAKVLANQGYDISKLTPQNSHDILSKIPMENGKDASTSIVDSMKNNMNAYGEQFIHDQYDVKYHRYEDRAGTTKKMEQSAVPVYTTPGQQVNGVDRGDVFDLHKKGTRFSYSDSEIQDIKNKYKNSKDGDELAANEIAKGRIVQSDSYEDINHMSKENKAFVLSGLQTLDTKLYDKVKNGGELTHQEKLQVFPKLKEIAEIAKQDLKQSSTSIGLTTKEAERTNLDLFGNTATGSNTVDNLGTGQAGNVKFFDKETGKVIDLSELKSKHDGKATVSVRGKLTADHPYSFVTSDDLFANSKQLFIDGKEYIVSGPKQYVDPDTGSSDIPENYKLQRTNTANEIYNLKFSLMPQLKDIYGVKAKIGFVPIDKLDRSKGVFTVKLASDNTSKSFNTAQEAEEFLLSQAK